MLAPSGDKYCNCYDLSAFVKIDYAAVGRKPDPLGTGYEVDVSPYIGINKIIWMTQSADLFVKIIERVRIRAVRPWGYVLPGPLFAWGDIASNCNSPFWVGDNELQDDQWNRPRYDELRTAFSSHCFLHYTNSSGSIKVLNICRGELDHNGQVILEVGGTDIAVYIQSQDVGAFLYGNRQLYYLLPNLTIKAT
ncbi:hypothetical protein MMC14_002402 [Varicellaria rhodocarpa]|nr:hypothetical protein [Varicellaria rhodocarpa]